MLTAHPADPEQLLLTVVKSNLGVRPKALALRIVQAENGFGAVAWGEEADFSADDALNGVSVKEKQERSAAVVIHHPDAKYYALLRTGGEE